MINWKKLDMVECDSNKQGRPDDQKIWRSYNLLNASKSFSTERKKMIIFHWEKSSVFDSTGSNDSSQSRCLDTLATNVLIYAGKWKSETDLRKMIKIMEEVLKIEENEKIPSSHA
jgi:hypothetical protein